MFVSLEGIDGSGKSTQATLLAEALGPGAVLVREPGGTEAGERIRDLVKDAGLELSPRAELLLFCAARAELADRVIRPALAAGREVICDRFADSTVAYQGAGRGLGAELAEQVSGAATDGLVPDLTVLIRLDPELALTRRGERDDRFEGEGVELQRTVAAAYDEIAAANPQRVVTVDGSGSVDQVHAAVMAAVLERAEGGRRRAG